MADRQVGPPYKGKHQEQAYADGREARAKGRGRDELPAYTAARRSLAESWLAGYDDAARTARAAADARRAEELAARPPTPPPAFHPLTYWPAGKPMPTEYVRPPVPCPSCRRLLTDAGGRAAIVRGTDDFARFRCRCCGHLWKLPFRR